MNANTMTQTTASNSPCGCTGLGAAPSPCGCGGKCVGSGKCSCSCESCQPQIYARPQFFAGQLLTEDDLQSLSDYVVAKNRLHNRYLFGDGVVCGLTVTCPPCETGHVTVNPGYALDCCGNDIVISCPKDLDINQMVHQLLTKLRRADCGDPCAVEAAANAVSAAQSGAAPFPGNASAEAGAQGATKRPDDPARRYCLYVDYCERSTDPVAPYASNAACGQGACEPTRVGESFKFELRCPTDDPCDSAPSDRFHSRIGDERAAHRVVADHQFLGRYLRSLEEALQKIRQQPVPPIDAQFWQQIKEHTSASSNLLEGFENDEEKLRPVLEQTLNLAGDVARVLLQPHPRALRKPELESLEHAESVLKRACEAIRPELIEQAHSATLARVSGLALFDIARELAAESLRLRSAADTAGGFESDFLDSIPARLLVERVIFDRSIARAVLHALASMRDWLVARLEQPGGTDCDLLCRVNAVSLRGSPAATDPNESLANHVVKAGEIFIPAVRELLRNCACDALIPTCAPCEATGVLLACLTVKDCKVTEICNLERKFVLTGPNIRYWLPEICRKGKELEKWCCPPCHREGEETAPDDEFAHRTDEGGFVTAMGSAPGFPGLVLSVLLEPRAAHESSRSSLARNILQWLAETGGSGEVMRFGGETGLRRQLENALAEIGALRRDQAKLRDRMSKIEAKRNPGERT
jgi:hypothetical protein